MFHHLKYSTSGANRSQYNYLTYARSIRSLLKIRQQDNKSTEGIYEKIDSMLLNLKLVDGNMHPEQFKTKEKYSNSTYNYEAAYFAA